MFRIYDKLWLFSTNVCTLRNSEIRCFKCTILRWPSFGMEMKLGLREVLLFEFLFNLCY